MDRIKQSWKRMPDKPRRFLTLVLGTLLIITSGLIGWIPGPGGMIPFLLGIAVLATEFEWAERFRDLVLAQLKKTGRYMRAHPYSSALALVLIFSIFGVLAYAFYTRII